MLDDFSSGFVAFFLSRDPTRVAADIVDILLVAYVLYRALLLIRGTRAMQMSLGLILVFAVHQAALSFGLVTLFSVFDLLLSNVVLIVVVIFQNDIRRALVRVGRGRFFRAAEKKRETKVIEEVVRASMALAQKRIGALMVFEREASLGEFIEHGTALDARVSKELLFSIFVPSYENPMHDGAVVIRAGKVAEAGVFLPLTEGGQLDRSYGTRHRAAIGISEETDAVVVVVSEERGAVSLCFNGNIVRELNEDSLRKALVGLFLAPAKKARSDETEKKKERRVTRGVEKSRSLGSDVEEPS